MNTVEEKDQVVTKGYLDDRLEEQDALIEKRLQAHLTEVVTEVDKLITKRNNQQTKELERFMEKQLKVMSRKASVALEITAADYREAAGDEIVDLKEKSGDHEERITALETARA